jgi:hypothetical protein
MLTADELAGDFGDVLPLETGDRQFVFARLARTVSTGQRRSAVGSAGVEVVW